MPPCSNQAHENDAFTGSNMTGTKYLFSDTHEVSANQKQLPKKHHSYLIKMLTNSKTYSMV